MSVYRQHAQTIRNVIEPLEKRLVVTTAELVFLASFLGNFVVGKMVHYFSPQEEVYSYYTNKRNILNQVFVKRGWGWTTVCIAAFYILLVRRPNIKAKPQLLMGAGVRWVLATLWWVLFTQWFFGIPLMDRIFVWTGGYCEVSKVSAAHETLFHAAADKLDTYTSNVVSSYQCRRLGGSWAGGHDPSGHVFLMVHSSLYMFLEGQHYWGSWDELWRSTARAVRGARHGHWNQVRTYVATNPHILLIGLISLWWFMLFMTNIYFHSIAEKFVGLLFGYSGIIAVYYVPRWIKGRK